MLNKLERFLHRYDMVQPGDTVVCAVSGGADSVALLFALYLLRDKLKIRVEAAHFNHRLRGAESDRDEAFVRDFCKGYGIALHVGSGTVVSGKKGLEAAAREARYGFLRSLSGKIATAHTADDNAETVLLHMVRGTGLKGLGGIAPVNGCLIRPMLEITRQEVLAFLQAYHLSHVSDSSNDTDRFLRNRLRHQVMPVLRQENPGIAENLSAMALRLRQDEWVLAQLAADIPVKASVLQQQPASIRSRVIGSFLQKGGVPEPEAAHIALVDKLIFSSNPSARADLPGGIVVERNYDTLIFSTPKEGFSAVELPCPGELELPELGLRVTASPATEYVESPHAFTAVLRGEVQLRPRIAGDRIRLSGGTRDLKKLYIDRKIPASVRNRIPVVADAEGIVGIYGIGGNKERLSGDAGAMLIRFEIIEPSDC